MVEEWFKELHLSTSTYATGCIADRPKLRTKSALPPTTLAYKCLNDVRNRAGTPSQYGKKATSAASEAFRQAVKDERGHGTLL